MHFEIIYSDMISSLNFTFKKCMAYHVWTKKSAILYFHILVRWAKGKTSGEKSLASAETSSTYNFTLKDIAT